MNHASCPDGRVSLVVPAELAGAGCALRGVDLDFALYTPIPFVGLTAR